MPWLFSLLGRSFTTTYLIVMSFLKTLYESGKYSDLIISCGEKQFNVHRAIVCTQCPWIAAACDGNFMVGLVLHSAMLSANGRSMQESASGMITIVDETPATVERVIVYLYTSEYDDGSMESHRNDDPKIANCIMIDSSQKEVDFSFFHFMLLDSIWHSKRKVPYKRLQTIPSNPHTSHPHR